MKIFTPKSSAIALAVAAATLAAGAVVSDPRDFDLTKLRYRVEPSSVFKNNRAQAVERVGRILDGDRQATMTRAEAASSEAPAPVLTLGPANNLGDIDGPDGQRWYYTASFVNEEIPPHDNVVFTDYILQEYSFDIYDSDMKYVGTIKDKMDYRDDEVRVPLCELTPVITRNFFNTDDKLELIVGLSVNAAPGYNHYRSLVYSLNGKKDSQGYDEPVYEIERLVGDVAEGKAAGGKDNYYITFMSDVSDFAGEADEESFWEYLCAQKMRFEIYGRALSAEGPRRLLDIAIPVIQLQGDQENHPSIISTNHGDDTYIMIGHYEQPFYNRYDNPMSDDLTQREDNNLIIDLYKSAGDELVHSSTSTIPVVRDLMADTDGNPTALFSYYCVGGLRHREDILFDAPGATAGKPWFFVTRSNYQISTDSTIDSYFTYSHEGERKATLFEYALGSTAMGDIAGFEPQQMFLSKGPWGYQFSFVDLYSGKTTAEIDYEYSYDPDSDAEMLTANLARTPDGKSYKYVCEMRYPLVDDQENNIMRFIWINADGSFDHIDNVNMGKGVAYAQSYMSTGSLAPHAYSVSDVPTYMMLVKRSTSTEVKIEELLIAQKITAEMPEGKTLLSLGPDDKGALGGIVPEFGANPRLMIYRTDSHSYTLDVYNLPLDGDGAGVSDIAAAAGDGFTLDGTTLRADGTVTLYTVAGAIAASGEGSIDLSTVNPGIYIVTAGGKASKILIK